MFSALFCYCMPDTPIHFPCLPVPPLLLPYLLRDLHLETLFPLLSTATPPLPLTLSAAYSYYRGPLLLPLFPLPRALSAAHSSPTFHVYHQNLLLIFLISVIYSKIANISISF